MVRQHPYPTIQGPSTNRWTGANPPTTASQHALRQGAGEEDGTASGRSDQEARAAEEPDFKDMDQYVAFRRDTSILEGIREDGLANRLVVVLLGFVLCGGLLFEVLKMFF
jgi:hypothetical protein